MSIHPSPFGITPASASATLDRLTPRQRELVAHVAMGLRNKEIAAAMRVKKKTVESQLNRIRLKLAVNRTDWPRIWFAANCVGCGASESY